MTFAYDWQFLRAFFGFHYFRYLVLWFAIVPVALSIFRDVPKEVLLYVGPVPIKLNTSLPFNWLFLWICAVIYIVAWAIYLSRVPRFIKQYNNYTEYRIPDHSPRWIVWEWYHYLNSAPWIAVDILISKGLVSAFKPDPALQSQLEGQPLTKPEKGKDETSFVFNRYGHFFRVALGPDTPDCQKLEKELFWELFGATAGSRRWSRRLIWTLLSIAGIMFALVIFQHIWAVIHYMGWSYTINNWGCWTLEYVSPTMHHDYVCR